MATAALLFRGSEDSQQDNADITRNLPSLTFESALDEDEQSIMHIRQQSHAHTVITCASMSFLGCILNEVRQIRADLAKTPKQRRAIQLLTADTLPRDPLKIGIIGCGRLGMHIAHSLLSFSEVKPDDLLVSTRRPETCGELKERGANVIFDNVLVATHAHLLIIAVLPMQLQELIEQIKPHMKKQTLVYCLVNNIASKKLKLTLDTTNFIIPQYIFDGSKATEWTSCISIQKALENLDVVEKCCPTIEASEGTCVRLTDKWLELVICAFMNMCTDLQLTSEAALDLLHGVCFGASNPDDLKVKFTHTDFIINWKADQEDRCFPKFDLSKIHEKDSRVIKKLRGNPSLTEAFGKKYLSVFSNYLEWKKYNGDD